jgi:hypothetical protein
MTASPASTCSITIEFLDGFNKEKAAIEKSVDAVS